MPEKTTVSDGVAVRGDINFVYLTCKLQIPDVGDHLEQIILMDRNIIRFVNRKLIKYTVPKYNASLTCY